MQSAVPVHGVRRAQSRVVARGVAAGVIRAHKRRRAVGVDVIDDFARTLAEVESRPRIAGRLLPGYARGVFFKILFQAGGEQIDRGQSKAAAKHQLIIDLVRGAYARLEVIQIALA